MNRVALAALTCLTTTCAPLRQVPDLTPAELLRHCDSLAGREVVLRLARHCWASEPGRVVVRTGKPGGLPVILCEVEGSLPPPGEPLVLVGVVGRVDRDGVDRGPGRDGTEYRHCVTVTACRPRVAVGF